MESIRKCSTSLPGTKGTSVRPNHFHNYDDYQRGTSLDTSKVVIKTTDGEIVSKNTLVTLRGTARS